jgi:alkanesulfonate monooxygenase SsuD/methylene tetrahydromethanopterin reductase-like flavin-dependent oxidoreductase (luciferase family)
MDGRWSPAERAAVEHKTQVSVVGSPGQVREGLDALLSETGADEFIATAQIYDHAARLRSFEVAADAFRQINEARRGTPGWEAAPAETGHR